MVKAISTTIEKPAKVRKSFSIKYKWQAMHAIDNHILHGHSLHTASEELKVPHWYYESWRKTVAKVDKLLFTKAIIPFRMHGDSCKIYPIVQANLIPLKAS